MIGWRSARGGAWGRRALGPALAGCLACGQVGGRTFAVGAASLDGKPGAEVAEGPAAARQIPPTSRSPEALALFTRGRDASEASALPQARELFRAALKLDPDFALAAAALGTITPGREGAALLDRAEAGAAALPEAERLLIARAAAIRRGDEPKAVAALERLGSIAPDDVRVMLALGERAGIEGRIEDETRILRRASKLYPEAPQVFNRLGYLLADRGDLPGAVNALRRYVVLLKDQANPLDSLGEILLRAGRSGDAEAAFLRALRLDPSFWYAGAGFAQSRFLRGDAAAARQEMERLLGRVQPVEALQIRTWLAWSWLASSAPDRAQDEVDALEREAMARHLDDFQARAALLRARFAVESADPGRALAALGVAEQRMAQPGVTGDQRNALRRRALVVRIRALMLGDHLEEAGNALQALEAEQAKAAANAELASTVHYARGLLLEARGKRAEALGELSKCVATHWACRSALAFAQARAGDTQAAAALRAALLAEPQRDPIWEGADANYLWAHAQLKRASL